MFQWFSAAWQCTKESEIVLVQFYAEKFNDHPSAALGDPAVRHIEGLDPPAGGLGFQQWIFRPALCESEC